MALIQLKIVRSFAWFVLLLLGCNLISAKLGLKYWQPKYHDDTLAVFAYQHSSEPYDLVFVGSSRTEKDIVSNTIEKELAETCGREFRVFNLGQKGSPVFTHQMVLRDILRGKRKPRIVVVEMGPAGLNSYTRDKRDTMRYYCGPFDMMKFIPHFRSAKDMYAALFGSFRDATNLLAYLVTKPDDGKHAATLQRIVAQGGGYLYDSAEDPFESLETFKSKKLERMKRRRIRKFREMRLKYYEIGRLSDGSVRDIITLCQKNGVNLIFLAFPLTEEFMEVFTGDEYSEFLEYMERVSSENEIEFYNYNRGGAGLSRADFVDFDHLNMPGAEKFSRHVAREVLCLHIEKEAL